MSDCCIIVHELEKSTNFPHLSVLTGLEEYHCINKVV